MKCEMCGVENPNLIIVLPLHQSNGKLNTLACGDCGRSSEVYCQKHEQIHQGFLDGTTACLLCVNELAGSTRLVAKNVANLIARSVPAEDLSILYEFAGASAKIARDKKIETALMRFVACKAKREKVSIEDVLKELKKRRSAAYLLL